MQVFKLYFKVLWRNKGPIIMYMCIFLSVVLGILIPLATPDEDVAYEVSKCEFAVFDYDNSEISKALVTYLESTHTKVEIKDDTKETMQDELYARNVDVIVRIQEGYEDKFLQGSGSEALEVVVIPGTQTANLFEQNLNSFMKVVGTYIQAGFEVDMAIAKANEIQNMSIEVNLPEVKEETGNSPMRWFFGYLGWTFVAMAIASIAPVLLVLDKKNARDRMACSAYKFTRINMEILLGVLLTGLVICMVIVLCAILFVEGSMWNTQGILFIFNMICFMAVSLSITFLVSKVTSNRELIAMFSNLVSLGMAFLCGVFVPMEVLGEGVIKVAHFLPAYWYEKAVMKIATYEEGVLSEIFSYMGIQLLFAVAIIIVAMAVSTRKRVSKENG